MNSKNIYAIVSFALVLIGVALLFFIYVHKEEKIRTTLQTQLELSQMYYNQMYENYRVLSESVHAIVINDEKTISIFKEAHNTSPQKRAEVREKLQEHLQQKYSYLKKVGFRQLHFHLSNNESFLRMHKPSKFGDDLSSVRYSIKKTNETLTPVEGFEEGRIVNGFRFVYPMFDENHRHIGSVEASVSSKGFIDRIESAYHSNVDFIIKKSAVDKKLWKEELNQYYVDSLINPEFYLEKKEDFEHEQEHQPREVFQQLSKEISQKLKKEEKFIICSKNGALISFLPVKNIKDEEVIAYFVIHTTSTTIEDAKLMYWMASIATFFIFLMLMFLLRKEFLNRKNIENLNKELEQKVQEGVQLSRQKDQQILLSSRLAQMGEMISIIAHQWRQPLAAIASVTMDMKIKLDLETFDLKKEEDRGRYIRYVESSLDDIESMVKNLTSTIDDFRNFYKPNKESTLVEINEPIVQALNIIRSSYTSKNITILERYACDEKIYLHSNEIMHVVLNILKNSQDAFKENKTQNPRVEMSTYRKNEEEINIKICDNAGGADKEVLAKIFDPYFSTKDEKNGSGLGLYMSKIIIEEHHKGTIVVENTSDGLCTILSFKHKGTIDEHKQ